MVLYDVVKKKKVISESIEDKRIIDNIFQICKRVVKELAESYQFVDQEMSNLVDEILELHMPFKPNPLLGWNEVSLDK